LTPCRPLQNNQASFSRIEDGGGEQRMPLSETERIHQLNGEIGDSVERALAELRQEISE